MNELEKYGFVADKNKVELNHVLNNGVFSKVHIDLYISSPYMLLSRIVDKDVESSIENNRTIIKRKDKTVLIDILLECIDECFVKKYSDILYSFVFKIHNICYKLLVAVTK